MQAIIGTKVGMTQVFDESGRQIPVTVLQVGPCPVVQRKTVETDGYSAVQLGFLDQKPQRLDKARRGHYAKSEVAPKRHLREIRIPDDEELEVGATVQADVFEGVGYVDVTGTSKGRGFQGVVKRYNMGGGRASHGGKSTLRSPGSIGMCEEPARVFKGKKMPGQMGNKTITVQNLKLVAVRSEDNAILVEGAVPGPNGGVILVRKALKKAAKSS